MASGGGQSREGRRERALRLAVVAGLAYVVAATAAEVGDPGGEAVSLLSVAGLAAGSAIFVVPPTYAALAAARHTAVRLAVLAIVTATAAVAGVLVATTDDAQAGLAILWVPYVALPLALLTWLTDKILVARRAPPTARLAGLPAPVGDRLAALVIDVAIVAGPLVMPLTRLSHSGRELLAAAIGIGAGAAYLGALVAWRRRTVGHALLALEVVRAGDTRRVGVVRSFVRGLILVVEVVGTATVWLAPIAGAELVATLDGGRSLTDRLLGTSVVVGAPVRGCRGWGRWLRRPGR